MCSNDLPVLAIPTELQPYMLTEVNSNEYHLTVLPHLFGDMGAYFNDYDMQHHAYYFAKLLAKFETGHFILVLNDEEYFFLDGEGVTHETDLPFEGRLIGVEHSEDPGSVRQVLAEKLKPALDDDRPHRAQWALTRREPGTGVSIYRYGAVLKVAAMEAVPGLDLDSISRFCRIYDRWLDTDGSLIGIQARNWNDLLFLGRWLEGWGLQGIQAPVDFFLVHTLGVYINAVDIFYVDITDPDPKSRKMKECLDGSLKKVRKGHRELYLVLDNPNPDVENSR